MKRGVILLNGEPPAPETAAGIGGSFIVCADGAYRWAKKYNITPDIILGDMDSYTDTVPESIPKLVFPSDKDETDGEIALRYLLEKGCRAIDLYGGSGRRDDHQLANYGLLYRALQAGAAARMITDYTDIYIADRAFDFDLSAGSLLSIVPFTTDAHIMNTEGLKYPLRDKVMHAYSSLGISNVALGGPGRIEVASGVVLLFLVKRIE